MRTFFRITALLSSSWLAVMLFAAPAVATPVFINEIHYDNTGTDSGEAIEIAGPAGVDLANWSLVLYNGSNNTAYNTLMLSGVIPDLASGYGVVVFNYAANVLQNGSPDAIALVNQVRTRARTMVAAGTIPANFATAGFSPSATPVCPLHS